MLLDLGDGVTMAFVQIPDGSFLMGSKLTPAESVAWFKGRGEVFGEGYYKDEHPRHRVHVKPFYMSKFEVTVAQFRRFVDETGYITDAEVGTPVPEKRDMKGGSRGAYTVDGSGNWILDPSITWRNPGLPQSPAHPVVVVSWNDAQAYVRWLSEETVEDYRLASESEWEYAARADTTESRYWGDDSARACVYANVGDKLGKRVHPGWHWTIHDCDDGAAETSPVGRYEANRFGLHDMLGNVWEWMQDCYVEGYDDAPSDGSAREGGGCTKRVIRGGSWFDEPSFVRSARRPWLRQDDRGSYVGIRLARTL